MRLGLPSFPCWRRRLQLAQDEYPDLDLQQVLGDVDQLLARLAGDCRPMHRRCAPADVEPVFLSRPGFAGNVNDYYDPDNSYLPSVLRTRRGIPISLAVLWIELAQGLGLSAQGVVFPGHFMVKVPCPRGRW
jgi:regulator of sirC expression with transglutaminase-like and TPR domain